MRLDLFLVEKGFYPSREKAKQAITLGRVFIDGKVANKPSIQCEDGALVECKPFEYVSRGGFKLEKALLEFNINLKEKVVLDIGASTGGFTDVCLLNGAKKVYAVDTGHGQLAEKLLHDKRVVNLEKTNYLSLSKENFCDANFVVIDVSFVSLTNLLPKLWQDFESLEAVALIKPQFECGIVYAKKHGGIVKDEKVRKKAVDKVVDCAKTLGFNVKKIINSPIKGGDGNEEFLMHFKK